MANPALVAWAVAAMTVVQPREVTPWAGTYEETAEALVTVAEDTPIYDPRHDGVRRSLAQLISLAWFESRFDPKAKGDGVCLRKSADGACLEKGPPQSFCAFQIGRSNFDFLKTTEDELLSSTLACTRAAVRMMKISISVCRGRPADEWLGQYASGGSTCAGLRESRHRVNKAAWIYAHVPFLPPS